MKIERIPFPDPTLSERLGQSRLKHSEGAALHTYRAVDHEQENRPKREQNHTPSEDAEADNGEESLQGETSRRSKRQDPHHIDVVV